MRIPRALATIALLALGQYAAAADLEVDFAETGGDGQAAWCASSTVAGLDPNGDGFLAVRSGPDTSYRMLARLHNGDVVMTCASHGSWVGVLHGPARSKGWVHGRWLKPLAG